MARPLALLLFALPALLLASPAAAERERRCSAAAAERTEIATIQSDYEAWRHRCVRLRGLAFGDRLYADREAVLEGVSVFGETAMRSIVIYDPPRRSYRPGGRIVEIVGTIFSCADQHAIVDSMRRPDTITWVTGYCHTSLANYVHPISVRPISRRAVRRLTEAEVAPGRRQIVEAPADLAGRDSHAAAGTALLTALATGDEETFLRFTVPHAYDEAGRRSAQPLGGWFASQLSDARAAFRRQSRRGIPPGLHPVARRQRRIFVDRRQLASTDPRDRPNRFISCWCKTEDCSGRWPVLRVDADNRPDRPYFCVDTADYIIHPGRTAVQAELITERRGLAEPTWGTGRTATP